MKFTQNEILKLHLGETIGPIMATKKEIHRAQANISNHKVKYAGAEFVNRSEPARGMQPDGTEVILKGWYNFYVTRTGIGISPDTGEPEPLV